MKNNSARIHKQAIINAFSKAAHTYDQAAIIEQEIGSRLLDRIEFLQLKPQYVLDLGSGTGSFTQKVQSLYPNAHVIGLDIAFAMTNFARQNNDGIYCCADAEQLPFANAKFDLIVSNCCFPSIIDLPNLFTELNNILTISGALMFTTFGPDTLQEFSMQGSWPDMHIIGDQLLKQNYKDPVVDSEHLTFCYNQQRTLFNDLIESGTFDIDLSNVENLAQPCQTTIEVIYGLAFKQTEVKQKKDKDGNIYVPLETIEFLNR
jgi:malonyl-CoA O-methyltransferase